MPHAFTGESVILMAFATMVFAVVGGAVQVIVALLARGGSAAIAAGFGGPSAAFAVGLIAWQATPGRWNGPDEVVMLVPIAALVAWIGVSAYLALRGPAQG